MLDNTLVLIIAQREERRALLRAIAQRYVVLLNQARAGSLLEPVGISGRRSAGSIQILIQADTVQHGIALCVIAPVEVISQAVTVGVQAVVHVCTPQYLAVLLGIEHFHLVGVGLYRYAGIEVNLDLAFLAFLGGDNNHTVGSTRTVDRGRGGILQYLDALDVVTVQLMHTGLCGNTIDDVQRVVVVQRADTTYTHRCRTRGRTVGKDVHAGHATLHGLHRVVFVLLGKLADTHYRNGTSQVGLTLGGITCYHHLVQR